ncbi:regulatory signaling modulator protein AmpE [Aliikangiella sp. IMCC44653]
MTLISVLIVLAAEFYFNWGAEYRNSAWFKFYYAKINQFSEQLESISPWLLVAVITLLPALALFLIINLFSGALYYLVLFISSCVVLFLCLGPKRLKDSFKPYFEALERGDKEGAYFTLEEESLIRDLPQDEEIVRNATRTILVESQSRYFGAIFWFIFLGPYGALIYRTAQTYLNTCHKNAEDELADKTTTLIHWLDWIPSRLTSIIFLFTGDFVNGFYRVRDYFVDLTADNRQLISETGIAALGLDMGVCDGKVEENKNAFAMVDRTLMIYVVAVAALSPLAFW